METRRKRVKQKSKRGITNHTFLSLDDVCMHAFFADNIPPNEQADALEMTGEREKKTRRPPG
jgi:hypothetical protein